MGFYHFDPNHDVDEQTPEPAQNHMVQVKLRFNTELAARGFLTHPGSVCIAWDVKSWSVLYLIVSQYCTNRYDMYIDIYSSNRINAVYIYI